MDDSNGSFFWDEREDFGGVFASESLQSNHHFHTANQSFYEEDHGSTRVTLSSNFDHQEVVDLDSSSQSSPLGLTLSKTPSFLNLLEKSLSKGKQPEIIPTKKMDEFAPEKLKASNFPATYIRIGSWERLTRNEGDITAKLYYAKHKLVWEVLEGALKSKIEIQWSDISGIRAITPDNLPGTLEIELSQPPLFYREINPQPRKHTLWQQSSDFTGGQAPIWRRHYVSFPPGVLDKHYEKLLQCDPRLLKLTENRFPTSDSPFFDSTMFSISQLSRMYNGYGSNYQYPYNNAYLTMPSAPSLPQPAPNLTMPAMNYPYANNNQFLACYGANQPNVGVMNNIEQQLLAQSHVSSAGAMCSLLEPVTATTTTAFPYAQTTGDQVIMPSYNPGIAEPLYSQQLNCLPPQQTHQETLLMEHQQINNTAALPQFYFQGDHNQTTGGFF